MLFIAVQVVPYSTDWGHWTVNLTAAFQGIVSFGIPDFVLLDTPHPGRFAVRFIVLTSLLLVVAIKCKRSKAWSVFVQWFTIYLCLLLSLGVMLGLWNWMLEFEARTGTELIPEVVTGFARRVIYCLVGVSIAAFLSTLTTQKGPVVAWLCIASLSVLGAIASSYLIWGDGLYPGEYGARRTLWILALMIWHCWIELIVNNIIDTHKIKIKTAYRSRSLLC